MKKKIQIKKKLSKFSNEQILMNAGWFVSLKSIADKFEENPTDFNKALLLGYISSAEFVVKNLVAVRP